MTSPLIRFDSWFFAKGKPHTLALLRIVFCSIAFLVLLIQSSFLYDYYGQGGLLSVEGLELWQWTGEGFNPLKYLSFKELVAFYTVILFACIGGILGLFTRVSLIITALGFLAFHNRNPLILNSGDALLRLVLTYLACSSCGNAYSLDRLRVLRSKKVDLAEQEVNLWPQRLIAIQIALLYFSAAWFKMQGVLWREGLVIWFVSRIEELQRFPVPEFFYSLWFSKVATYGTLILELALCTLVWFKPYRSWILAGGVLLHAGISYQFNIPFFGLITVSCYLAFYSSSEIQHFMKMLYKRVTSVRRPRSLRKLSPTGS